MMSLHLTPELESRVRENAAQEGISVSEYIARLMPSVSPTISVASNDPAARVQALLAQWQKEDGTPLMPAVPAHELFALWDAENAAMTEEEREAEEEFWNDFVKGLNKTRTELGMRSL